MGPGRAWLRELTSERLVAVMEGFPGLAPQWAQLAQTTADQLAQGQKRAVNAVKASILRNPVPFHDSLAVQAIAFGLDDEPVGPTDVDPRAVAAQLGHTFGPEIGGALIRIIGESTVPVASEFSERIEELLKVAGTAQSDAPPDGGFTLSGLTSPTIDCELTEINELLRLAPPLARQLSEAADLVASGCVPSLEFGEISQWMTRAARMLPNGGNLGDRAASLAEARRVQQEKDRLAAEVRGRRHQELMGTLKAVRTLAGQGLANFIPGILAQGGFESVEDVEAALAAIEAEEKEVFTSDLRDPTDKFEVATSPLGGRAEPREQSDNLPLTDVSTLRDAYSLWDRGPRSHGEVDQLGSDAPEAAGQLRDLSAIELGDSNGTHLLERVERIGHDESLGTAAMEPTDPVRLIEQAEQTEQTDQPQPRDLLNTTAEPAAVFESVEEGGAQVDSSDVYPEQRTSGGVAQDDSVAHQDSSAMPGDPWSDPSPPLIAQLISDGRGHLAELVGRVVEPGTARTRALSFFVAVFGVKAEALQLELPDLVLSPEELDTLHSDEFRVLLAGGVKLALELGYSPIGSLDQLMERAALDEHPMGPLLQDLCRLAKGGVRPSLVLGDTEKELVDAWASLAESSAETLRSFETRRVSYQRATKIIHHLARESESLGGGLKKINALAKNYGGSREEWGELTDLASSLRRPAARDRLIDAADRAVSNPQQRRNPVIAAARAKLLDCFEEVALLIERGLALQSRSEDSGNAANTQGVAQLWQGLDAVDEFNPETTGEAALVQLARWLDGQRAVPAASLSAMHRAALLPLYEIPRDSAGIPVRQPTSDELYRLISGRDDVEIVRGYARVGNREAVDEVLAGVESLPTEDLDDFLVMTARDNAINHRALLAEADRILARLRAMGDDDAVRALGQSIEDHRAPSLSRVDLSIAAINAAITTGVETLDAFRTALVNRLDAIQDPAVVSRIQSLIEADDEPLALEFLTLAESGTTLPTLDPPPGDDFAEFFPMLVNVASRGNKGADSAINAVRTHLKAAPPESRMLVEGLRAWRDLSVRRQSGPPEPFGLKLASVLRFLGLIPAPERWLRSISHARRAGFSTFEISATPIDRSYVPSLGTQAHGLYDVTLVWEQSSPQRLINYVDDDRRSRANVILYFGVLTENERLELRRLTSQRGSGFSPLVVDHAVVGWLSTMPDPAWRRTQRVTLPFTTLNPYTPFAGGEVPDEVFVGREAERREIVEPTGSMFVYGGRQLGKSALLRKVEKEFMGERRRAIANDVSERGRLAIYMDLKSAGIGESVPSSGLWPTLAQQLTRLKVIPDDRRRAWNGENLPEAIIDWLDADQSRRLLLLLDESDNFLTSDSRDVGASGLGGFPTLQKLKGLMERSDRRFKTVFAGLHQVQRFHDLPNTPVAHGGKSILVGPLSAVDARQLVRDPMYALGYEFETPETMWRLLVFTNYQASLIQIICYQLLLHMKNASLPRGGGRVVITNQHVDEVYAKPEVRDQIAARFRWTINLDPRYLVIAMVTAVRSFDTTPGEGITAGELQDECEFYWPAAFLRENLSSREFSRYLHEMSGLGVLQSQGDGYVLRSPSIRGLLGSREAIESELLEVAENLEVEQGYNPAFNRRILGTSQGGNREIRSPLCDSDLVRLLNPGSVHIVVGTEALGIDRVAAALELATIERGRAFNEVSPDILATHQRPQELRLCRLEAAADKRIVDILNSAEHRRKASLVLLAQPDQLGPISPDDPRVIQLQRWSLEALQSWPETPFATPALRHSLKRVTGGWLGLVERAMTFISEGSDPQTAIARVGALLDDPKAGRAFLESTGVPLDIARRWVEWFGVRGPDTQWEASPATYADLDAAELGMPAIELISRLQLGDLVDETDLGWVLDRAVTQAAAQSAS